MPQQFENPANPEIHRKTTAEEIWNDTQGKVDILVSGVGTGGTITGVGEVIKKTQAALQGHRGRAGRQPGHHAAKMQGVPSDQVKPGRHRIQGIGAGFIPGVLNVEHHRRGGPGQRTTTPSTWPAGWPARKACCAASAAGPRPTRPCRSPSGPRMPGKLIVVVLPDLGERYLSTPLFPE